MQKTKTQTPILLLSGFFLLIILILSACGGADAPAPAEEAAQEVERVEVVVEEVEETAEEAPLEAEAEMAEEMMDDEAMAEEEAAESISATSSEDEDASPHEPSSGAKAEPTRAAAEVALADAEVRVAEDGGEGGNVVEVEVVKEVEVENVIAIDAVEVEEVPTESQLTAGEIDDNEHWDDYLLYLRKYVGPEIIWVDVVERHTLTVVDGNGRPIAGQQVDISADGQIVQSLRTHSDGSILIFPGSYNLPERTQSLEAVLGSTGDKIMLELGTAQREWELSAPSYVTDNQVKLDVHFLIDTTGSMADEIEQLRDNMIAISQQIDALPAAPDVRYGMTLYRDRRDVYVTKSVEFMPDINAFVEELNKVEADGGGDYPEDLTEGLFQALNKPEWRIENTVSLIFLIADAPPHLDYGDSQFNYAVHTQQAAELGVKIFSIASSGLDQQGEYVFRQMAQMTGGRFIFLTYGEGGAGTTGDRTDMTVDPDDFTVEALDELIVSIVEEELGYRQ